MDKIPDQNQATGSDVVKDLVDRLDGGDLFLGKVDGDHGWESIDAEPLIKFIRSTDTGGREEIARIINPFPFKEWQSLHDHCVQCGDSEEEALKCANSFHKPGCDEALTKADAILAIRPIGSPASGAAGMREALALVKPRRPLHEDEPDGYLESDLDWVRNNCDAMIAILEACQPAPSEAIPVGRDEEPFGWVHRHSSQRYWAFSVEEPTGPSIHLFEVKPLYSTPLVLGGDDIQTRRVQTELSGHDGSEAKSGIDLWRHKKRGTVYRVLHNNVPMQENQTDGHRLDDEPMVVYQDVLSGAVYVRPVVEMWDGRFEQVEPASSTALEHMRELCRKIAQPWPGADFDPSDPVCAVRKKIADAIAAIQIDGDVA